jgi:hypothetical protein
VGVTSFLKSLYAMKGQPFQFFNEKSGLVMQSVIATHASAILDFFHELRGTLQVTFEEGTHSALAVRRAGATRGQVGSL